MRLAQCVLEEIGCKIRLQAYSELEKEFAKYISIPDMMPTYTEKTSKIIWVCWFQEMDNAPSIVKACNNQLNKVFPDYKKILITEQNFTQYVDIDSIVLEKWKKGIISNTIFSNILRLELLIKQGGVWIDSTILCTAKEMPKYIADSSLFMYRRNNVNMEIKPSGNWLMSSCKNHNLLIATRDLLVKYWSIKDAIIISGRNQAVISINKTTKQLNWILSEPINWLPKFHKYLLKPTGNDFEYPYAQHNAILTKDRTLLLFDNGIYRSLNKEIAFAKDRVEYSRGVEYKIDIENMTVEQVWQFGKEREQDWYSKFISSIQQLDNNNILMCSGGIKGPKASVVEVNPINNNEIVREFKINNSYCYRAKRIDIPSEVENTPLATEILYDDYFEEHPTNIHINKNHYLHIENVNELVSDEQLQTELGIRATFVEGNRIRRIQEVFGEVKGNDLINVYYFISDTEMKQGNYKIYCDLIQRDNKESIVNTVVEGVGVFDFIFGDK
ncbi:MAG: hypothetical protein ATN35_01825 [Epulopiscium sp. Nele67-Bin004]|nr:MAG: hypothetical protein ATN35_01825 [Epulopiscium sp. Nele67-Bin004]